MTPLKIILFTTALLYGVFASYWIWKVEREARIAAESKANNQEKWEKHQGGVKYVHYGSGRFNDPL
jgi:hypothetical protein